MEIVKKLSAKAKDNMNMPGVTVAFLGDSVTQGCFELYKKAEDVIETVFDKNNAYHAHFAKALSVLYPTVPVNIINAGISGDRAPHALERIDVDVISHNPDLVVVCFGLNDSLLGRENVDNYANALRNIFLKLKEKNIETIFMTPNMMNTYVSYSIEDESIKNVANDTYKIQTDGVLEYYLEEAKKVCNELGVTVCDCYGKWKKLYESGVDTTELLSNKMNHPTRDMNWLFAVSLLEKIFE